MPPKRYMAHRVVKYWSFLLAETVDFSTLNRFRQIIVEVEFLTVD